ncbi:hypothetical protein N9891_02120 [bacterium]|nr:hypothetical protein [bacterium]
MTLGLWIAFILCIGGLIFQVVAIEGLGDQDAGSFSGEGRGEAREKMEPLEEEILRARRASEMKRRRLSAKE